MYKVGDRINGEYDVSAVYTNGGMGIVYRINHLSWQMELAIKSPRGEFFQDEQQKSAFIKECETWMDLGFHPNIVTCYFIRQIHGVPNVFMEYVDGGSLLDCIRTGVLYRGTPSVVLERIIDIAIQTARGLAYAHSKGYIHQDVKPANVLLSKSGIAKVSDFGLSKAKRTSPLMAKAFEARSMMVSSGGWTPAYGSPEQALGRTLTRRTDVWSWGTMLLEMIHGSLFWNVGPLASRALRKIWPWKIFAQQIKKSAELLGIIRDCLNEDEGRRPRDFDILEQRLLLVYEHEFQRKYQREVPPEGLLTEASLVNNIASYSELSKSKVDCYGKIYDCRAKLHQIAPWSVWGDLNYMVYRHVNGCKVEDLLRQISNQLQNEISYDMKLWFVDVLLRLGVSQCDNRLYERIGLNDSPDVLEKVRREDDRFGYAVREILEQEPFSVQCERPNYSPSVDKLHGQILLSAQSQNGRCKVCVVEHDRQTTDKCDIFVSVDGHEYQCEEFIYRQYHLKFVTVDDHAIKISLWILDDRHEYHQKVLALKDGKLISYRCDFRLMENWGDITSVYESGDARIMMLLYFNRTSVRCRVWVSDEPCAADGRNVCDIDLVRYGSRVREDMLDNDSLFPQFLATTVYKTDIQDSTAYRLMARIAQYFNGVSVPCYIFRPQGLEKSIKRYKEARDLVKKGVLALESKGDEAIHLLSEAVGRGVIPDAEVMARRHRRVMSEVDACPSRVWFLNDFDEYWASPMRRLISLQGSVNALRPGSSFWKFENGENGAFHVVDNSSDRLVMLGSMSNGDVIALRCEVSSGLITHVERAEKNAGGCGLTVKWSYAVQGQSVYWYNKFAIRINEKILLLNGRSSGEDCVLLLDLNNGCVVQSMKCKYAVEYVKCDFNAMSPWGLFVATSGGVLLFDRGFNRVSQMANYHFEEINTEMGSIHRCEVLDVSGDGTRILIRNKTNVRLVNIMDGTCVSLIEDEDCANWRKIFMFAMSDCGRAVACVTPTYHLVVYDVKKAKKIFDWKLTRGLYQDMCFDKTGRWIVLLHDYTKIDVFQVFWDIPTRA